MAVRAIGAALLPDEVVRRTPRSVKRREDRAVDTGRHGVQPPEVLGAQDHPEEVRRPLGPGVVGEEGHRDPSQVDIADRLVAVERHQFEVRGDAAQSIAVPGGEVVGTEQHVSHLTECARPLRAGSDPSAQRVRPDAPIAARMAG